MLWFVLTLTSKLNWCTATSLQYYIQGTIGIRHYFSLVWGDLWSGPINNFDNISMSSKHTARTTDYILASGGTGIWIIIYSNISWQYLGFQLLCCYWIQMDTIMPWCWLWMWYTKEFWIHTLGWGLMEC